MLAELLHEEWGDTEALVAGSSADPSIVVQEWPAVYRGLLQASCHELEVPLQVECEGDSTEVDIREGGIIDSPESLLAGTDEESIVAQTMHANTLFSQGAIDADGNVRAEVTAYLDELSERGTTHLYAIGLWRASQFSRLVMPFWANECWDQVPDDLDHIGPSCFSIQDYVPRDEIGSWENLAKITQAARERGIRIAGDLVTNTIAPDSDVAINHPEIIEGTPLDALPDWLQHVGEMEHGWERIYPYAVPPREDWPSSTVETNWDGATQAHELNVYRRDGCDVIVYERRDQDDIGVEALSYRTYIQQFPQGRRRATSRDVYTVTKRGGERSVHRLGMGRMGDDSPDLWADTLWLNKHSEGLTDWMAQRASKAGESLDVLRWDMAHLKGGEFYAALAAKLGDLGVDHWAEAYDEFVDPSYLYSFMDRLYTPWVAKRLRGEDIGHIMGQLRNPGIVDKMRTGLSFIANHDEAWDSDHRRMGAANAILCSLPGGVLQAQGQVEGLTWRFSADSNIPLSDYREMVSQSRAQNYEYTTLSDRISKNMSSAVFRSSCSRVKEPEIRVKSNGSEIGLEDGRYQRVFRTARLLGEDRVVSVVNFQEHHPGEQIVVKRLPELFELDESDSLDNYVFVDLVGGHVLKAEEQLVLNPHQSTDGSYKGYDVHMYALVRKDRLAPKTSVSIKGNKLFEV